LKANKDVYWLSEAKSLRLQGWIAHVCMRIHIHAGAFSDVSMIRGLPVDVR
jgi:hypothetical protein